MTRQAPKSAPGPAAQRRARLVKGGLLVGLSAAVFAGILALREQLGIEFDPEALRDFVNGLGMWAPLGLIAVVTFRLPLGLPSQVVLIAGGLCFGTRAGTVYGAVGLTCSAVILFSIARLVGRDVIARRVPERLRPMLDAASSNIGAAFLAVGTGYPFGPISAYHSMAGVTGISFLKFVLAVSCGALIRAGTYTYFGSSLITGDIDRILIASGVIGLSALVPLLFPKPRSWVRQLLRPDTRQQS